MKRVSNTQGSTGLGVKFPILITCSIKLVDRDQVERSSWSQGLIKFDFLFLKAAGPEVTSQVAYILDF